jgi:predicted GNAT family N-acyltransferase
MRIILIQTPEELDSAFAIRQKVFVEEQRVSPEEEYDEYETTSMHYLAVSKGNPIGTARWRWTDKGIKLERFAVLEQARSQGVGSELLKFMLADIRRQTQEPNLYLYLHSQLPALEFYKRFGFVAVGEQFEECEIQHFKMEQILP